MDDRLTEIMRAYAEQTVAYARRVLGVDLDYSEHSLEDLDRVLDAYAEGEAIDPASLAPRDEEDVWTFCKMIGGYLGEVIARNVGGAWALHKSSVVLVCGTLEGRPPDAIWEIVTTRTKRLTSYYRTLLVALGHGTRSAGGVTLRPLSREPRRLAPVR